MRDKKTSFIPFYLKPNKQRIVYTAPSVDFPNYMNWQRQYNQKKRDAHQQHGNWWGKCPGKQQLNRKDRCQQTNTPYISETFFSRKLQTKKTLPLPQQRYADKMSREIYSDVTPEYFERKEAYYQQIREELNEMAFYQSRRPFKATQIPSKLQGSGSSKVNKQHAIKKESKIVNKDAKGHLNRSLESIMDQENPTIIGKSFIGSQNNKNFRIPDRR